jgi:methyltransferase
MTLAVFILGVVTLQRLAELVLARRNTLRLRTKGAYEVGAEHYPLIVALHAAWLSGLWYVALHHGHEVEVRAVWLGVFVILQGLRLWIIAILGERWTTRIIVLPRAPLVAGGPYRLLRHPNYCVVAAEILTLPLALGLVYYGIIFSLLNAAMLSMRVRVEDAALGVTVADEAGESMRDPNRFWWLSLLVFATCWLGVWGFERAVFPQNNGFVGGTVGFVLGAFLAALFEDYVDQSTE